MLKFYIIDKIFKFEIINNYKKIEEYNIYT